MKKKMKIWLCTACAVLVLVLGSATVYAYWTGTLQTTVSLPAQIPVQVSVSGIKIVATPTNLEAGEGKQEAGEETGDAQEESGAGETDAASSPEGGTE